nr:hypothetical protein [Tanacetum cinerariifolium]
LSFPTSWGITGDCISVGVRDLLREGASGSTAVEEGEPVESSTT